MTYDNWKSTDPAMEREGRILDSLDTLISNLGDIWEGWGLELVIDTPDLSKQEWIDRAYDYMIDDTLDTDIATMLMETWIEGMEGNGPYEMDPKTYRALTPVRRAHWRIERLAIQINDMKRSIIKAKEEV